MYIDSDDYQTVWNLGHDWVGYDPEATEEKNLPKDLQFSIQRLLAGILRNDLPARSNKMAIFVDDSV